MFLRSHIAALLCFCCHATLAENVVSDTLLSNVDFRDATPAENVWDAWRWDPIRLPSSVRTDQPGMITLQGITSFLQSPFFPTQEDSSVSYKISAVVRGKGHVRIEAVWWDQKKSPASPHVEVVATNIALSKDFRRVEVTAHPARSAIFGQIRFVQQAETPDGVLTVARPAVQIVPRRFVPGELLLALDAAQPGDAPQQEWQDLTGLNRPFRVVGTPQHDRQREVFTIDSREDYFEGAVEDESRFDFDTAKSTGRTEPFTIILYATLDGPSHGGVINKLEVRKRDPNTGAMLDAPGWLLSLGWNEFGGERLEFHQMLNNLHDRIISRHGGTDSKLLSVQPGQMNLFVVHVPGDGVAGSIQMFMDGRLIPEKNVPWPGGSLSGRSIQNDVPLKIGGGIHFLAKGLPLFTGSIGFVEIWKGRGLWKGMTPEQYGKIRWNNGQPVRGLILER